MRVYLQDTVLEAAEKRIRFLVREFDNVCATISGGKDSTVIYDMVYRIAKEEGKLPIYCLWIDQEAEYQSTVDIVEDWMTRDGVIPLWAQVKMRITNGAGHEDDYLYCWHPDDEDKWMREKHPLAITENTYGSDRLDDLFARILHAEVDGNVVGIGGVRCEESPNRYVALTSGHTYKGITYGLINQKFDDVTTMYPIYDWTYADVWKYIHDNDLRYNRVYDKQYQLGVPIRNMRVSHLHHQHAITSLFTLQEFEPETHNKLVERVKGIHTTQQFTDGVVPDELPFMFKNWREYRDYLLEKLIEDEEHKTAFKKMFFNHDTLAEHLPSYDSVLHGHVQAIVTNDFEGEGNMRDILTNISNDSTRAMRDRKREYLKTEHPETWDQLVEEGIIHAYA